MVVVVVVLWKYVVVGLYFCRQFCMELNGLAVKLQVIVFIVVTYTVVYVCRPIRPFCSLSFLFLCFFRVFMFYVGLLIVQLCFVTLLIYLAV